MYTYTGLYLAHQPDIMNTFWYHHQLGLCYQTQYLPFILLMKDLDKQREQDQIWKKVCGSLDCRLYPKSRNGSWIIFPTIFFSLKKLDINSIVLSVEFLIIFWLHVKATKKIIPAAQLCGVLSDNIFSNIGKTLFYRKYSILLDYFILFYFIKFNLISNITWWKTMVTLYTFKSIIMYKL